jgi:hypothetical protein
MASGGLYQSWAKCCQERDLQGGKQCGMTVPMQYEFRSNGRLFFAYRANIVADVGEVTVYVVRNVRRKYFYFIVS